MVWDKSDVVHMDDAMAVPATGGFYKSVAHHFYEVSSAVCHHHVATSAAAMLLDAAIIGTSNQPCWLAEACKIFLLLVLVRRLCASTATIAVQQLHSIILHLA